MRNASVGVDLLYNQPNPDSQAPPVSLSYSHTGSTSRPANAIKENAIMNFKAKHLIATPSDIRTLVRSFLKADDKSGNLQADYLKCLVGTTQHEIKAGEVEPLKALTAVHDRFYEEVVAADKDRTGFARSAKSTLLAWMRVENHDILKLKPEAVTKGGLAAETPVRQPRPPSMPILARRAAVEADRMSDILKRMVALDPQEARKTIDALVTQFSDLFDEVKGARIGRIPATAGARPRGRPRSAVRHGANMPLAA